MEKKKETACYFRFSISCLPVCDVGSSLYAMAEPDSDAERFLSQRIVSEAQFADSDDDGVEKGGDDEGDTSESGWASTTQYSQAEDWNQLEVDSDDAVEEYSDDDDAVDGWYVSESDDGEDDHVADADEDEYDSGPDLGLVFDDDSGEDTNAPGEPEPTVESSQHGQSLDDEALETVAPSPTRREDDGVIDNGDGTVTGARGGRYSKCWKDFLKPRATLSRSSKPPSSAKRPSSDSDMAGDQSGLDRDDSDTTQQRTHTKAFLSRYIEVYANERIVMPIDIDTDTYDVADPEAEIYGLLQCDMRSFIDPSTQVYILPGHSMPITQKNMLIDRVSAYCQERDQRDRLVNEFNDAQQQEAQDVAERRNRRHNLFDHRSDSESEDEALHRINDLVTTAPNISMFTQGTREFVRAEHVVLKHQRESAEKRRVRDGYHPMLGVGNGQSCTICRYHIRGSLQDKAISVVKMGQLWAERMANRDFETTWILLRDHWNTEVVGDSKVAISSIPRLTASDMEWHYMCEGVDSTVIEASCLAQVYSLAIHNMVTADLFVQERIGGKDTGNVSVSKKGMATVIRASEFYLKLLRTIDANVKLERAVAGTALGMMPGIPNARLTLGFSDQVRLERRTHETQDENASRAIAQILG